MRAHDPLLPLDGLERCEGRTVERDPATVPGLVSPNAKGPSVEVHVLPLERLKFTTAHPRVERQYHEGTEPTWQGIQEAGLLIGAEAAIARIVFLEQLDRPHRIVVEGSLANRSVEDSLEELEVVVNGGDG